MEVVLVVGANGIATTRPNDSAELVGQTLATELAGSSEPDLRTERSTVFTFGCMIHNCFNNNACRFSAAFGRF
jgi:hypothetical protein